MKYTSLENQYLQNPEIKKDEIAKLLLWCSQQSHLPEISELEAILFFHSCRFSMELTKQTLDIFFTIRTHCPEFFDVYNCNNDGMKRILKCVAIYPLPTRTKENFQIFMCKITDSDLSNFNFNNSIKLYCMLYDLWLMENGTSSGHIIVSDLSCVTLGHITKLGPLSMKKFLFYLQEALPIRIVGFHFINIIPHTDKLLALMKPFMKKELIDVLHLHPNMKSFEKFIPLSLMPSDYVGGIEADSKILIQRTYENLIQNEKFFEKCEMRKVDENQRAEKQKNSSSLFGVEGNFKKLEID